MDMRSSLRESCLYCRKAHRKSFSKIYNIQYVIKWNLDWIEAEGMKPVHGKKLVNKDWCFMDM